MMCSNLAGPRPVVHLELHTADRAAASAFLATLLCWRPEVLSARGRSYLGLDLGGGLDGGIVECGAERPAWLPYVEVESVEEHTRRALALGAEVVLGPREGPVGWRSVVRSACAGEVAFWQPKR